jgi:isopentenyldiphosphate isomerase
MIAKDNSEEIFPIVDEDGRVLGSATRGECHSGSKLLHPVVHLHLFDKDGKLYLQRRPEWKDIQPGKWDTAVGGHVDFGEKITAALHREAKEELGLEDFEEVFIASYVYESDREKELINAFRTVTDSPIEPTEELDGGRFWSLNEIRAHLGKNIFTPNFEYEFINLLNSDVPSKKD